jgi:hypothetical protein
LRATQNSDAKAKIAAAALVSLLMWRIPAGFTMAAVNVVVSRRLTQLTI